MEPNVPSRTRIVFVSPVDVALANKLGTPAHQGKHAYARLVAWATNLLGPKLVVPKGWPLAGRARAIWDQVPRHMRLNTQLYIIKERRGTPWKFSLANPYAIGLRPAFDAPLRPSPKSKSVTARVKQALNAALGAGLRKDFWEPREDRAVGEIRYPAPELKPKTRKRPGFKAHKPVEDKPKPRLQIGVWN